MFKKIISVFFTFLVLGGSAWATYNPYQIVFDPQGLEQSVTSYEQMLKQYDQFENYKEQIGNGDLTPSTVNKLSQLYEKCGGKKFGLPDWFPRFKVEMCADDGQLFALQVDWMKETYLPLSTDSAEQKKAKAQKKVEDRVKIIATTLSRSVVNLDKREEKTEKATALQDALDSSKNQIEVQKVQLQVQIEILKELQELNNTQSLMLHLMSME